MVSVTYCNHPAFSSGVAHATWSGGPSESEWIERRRTVCMASCSWTKAWFAKEGSGRKEFLVEGNAQHNQESAEPHLVEVMARVGLARGHARHEGEDPHACLLVVSFGRSMGKSYGVSR